MLIDERLDIESLYSIGFKIAARWVVSGDYLNYEFELSNANELKPLFRIENALYSFCRGNEVLYIGKTARSLAKRFTGYCKPGQSQATNKRCHMKIKDCISRGETVSILVFTPIDLLQYAGFSLNLAAGLEDALINRFNPPWNGKSQGHAITESAEIETDVISKLEVADADRPSEVKGTFLIRLKGTYYHQGIVNPGVEASRLLGAHDEMLVVNFDDETPPLQTRIDRKANANGSVRLVGNNKRVADWFSRHFKLDDVVTAQVLGSNEIELVSDPKNNSRL